MIPRFDYGIEIRIADLLASEGHIILDLPTQDKAKAIREMVDALDKHGAVLDKQAFFNCLMEREALESTGIGGIALPHVRTDAVGGMVMVFARSQSGIDFAALDAKPVHFLVLIASTRNDAPRMLKLLAKVSRLFHNAEFRQILLSLKSKTEIRSLFASQE